MPQSSPNDLTVIQAALEKIMQKSRSRAALLTVLLTVLLAVLRPILDRAIAQVMEQPGVFLGWLGITG